jgi:hypothetical protein
MTTAPRTLSIIPIVHTQADLGDLGEQLRASIGHAAWAKRQRVIEQTWQAIAEWADTTDAAGLHVYQDGLPVVDDPEPIIDDLAAKGSINHAILASLADRGATILGTEDPGLLVREYELAKAASEAAKAGRQPDPRDAQRAATILARRDRFIADRITTTMPERGRGVLFIGMLHDVESQLDPSIQITHPIGRQNAAETAKEHAQ